MGLSLLVISRSCDAVALTIVVSVSDGLSDLVRSLMRELQAETAELDRRIASYDHRIREIFRNNGPCQRLGKIEGIGPVRQPR